MRAIVIDFETRSRVDLKKAGAYKYASDPSTDILCMAAYDIDTDQEWLWYPTDRLPLSLSMALSRTDLVVAVNAEFDKAIWEFIAAPEYGAPVLADSVWYCAAAQFRVNALPGALEKAARALGIKVRKDKRGAALIKLLSIPNKHGEFNEDPKALQAMGEYCQQDVLLTVQVMEQTRWMSATEHYDWQITCKINERGARIDRELAKLAVKYAADERDDIAEALTELTKGVVTKHTQSIRARDWVLEQCKHIPEVRETMIVSTKNDGDLKYSFDKDIRARLLDRDDLPPAVEDFIDFMDQGNKSSVAKFQRMLDMMDPEDDRVRGAFVFAGAGQTQRFASRGLQLHNMRRDCWNAAETEDLKADMADDYAIPDVMDTLSQLLRPAIIPEQDHVFVVSDWSAIEGRILPWLTLDPRADAVLEVFKRDEDIYMHTADGMGLDDRQIGKVATLALGYQGAVGAFVSMAKNYGLHLPEERVIQVVKKWRKANPWAVQFWASCERAAVRAMKNPGDYIPIGRCQFVAIEGMMGTTLCGILPDGTIIQYPDARLEYVETKHGGKMQVSYMKASLTPKADEKEWPRHVLYGGLIAENFTQGTAGALLRHALRELDKIKAPVALHVHDEIVEEVHEHFACFEASRLQKIMQTPPDWAEGLPLKAKPELMKRYGKPS